MKYKYTLRYALIGAAFGLVFPIIATIVDTLSYDLFITLENLVNVQSENHLLWIIDTAPLFLGAFASLAGIRQDRLIQQNNALENEILARKQAFEELDQLKNNLDQEVNSRTALLEKRAIQLSASTEVGQTIVSIRNLDTLLNEVTVLISDRFGFYHVGIFLNDISGEYAVLRAANSEGGKRMLSREHKLKVGEAGIVGYTSSQRTAHIAQEVGSDAVYFDNPDLPDTRSEMALPLIVGEKLLGILDIQSKKMNIFDKDDIDVLQGLANQVAVAIENAQMFAKQQDSLEATRRVSSDLSQQAWLELLNKSEFGFISSNTLEIQSVDQKWTSKMLETASTAKITYHDNATIHIPIILRGQTLGVVRLRKPEGAGNWSTEEINFMDSLVNQLEAALEAARLYTDTQIQAGRERLTHEITDKLHRSLDIDTLMQTFLQEISTALDASGAFVQLSTGTESPEPTKSRPAPVS